MNQIPRLKPLAIVEQEELYLLKQKKLELELKLKQKEQQSSKKSDDEENYSPSPPAKIEYKQKKERNDKYSKQTVVKDNTQQNTLAQMKEQERQENELKNLKSQIAHLEKEKKLFQKQFDQIKESIRADNMMLKEQTIKSKAEANGLQKQKDDMENDKISILKENRKLKLDYRVLQEKHAELVKQSAEYEAKSKSNKDTVFEREDRIRWAENKLIQEEEMHKQTQHQCMQLQNEIQNLKKEIEFHKHDRNRLSTEIEELMFQHNKKYEELHEGRLRDQRNLNDAKLNHEEFKRILNQEAQKIRQLELERERLFQRVEDYEIKAQKLQARDREIIELEVELDRVKRAKGTHIIEKIVEPIAYTVPSLRHEIVQHPVQDEEIIQLREDLLYFQQDRDRALDEADYWRQRYQDLELQEDRTINLLAHQNAGEYQKNNDISQEKQELFTKVLALINDLNNRKRNSDSEDVKEAIEQVLNNNNGLLKYLMK